VQVVQTDAAAAAKPWRWPTRVAFRFGCLLAALIILPFPLGYIPGTMWLGRMLREPWYWAVSWFSRNVLGIADPATAPTGSGDTTWHFVQLLLIAILAGGLTLIWSAVDHRRKHYRRLAHALVVLLRYYLAYFMLLYGISKVFKAQFPDLGPPRMDDRVGDMSPMGLLWTFMGHSTPYTVFAGACEMLGGILLLWRRTVFLGALLITVVMTNVVVLNMSYDVPVKLFSLELLAMALVIAAPHARRVLGAAFGHATPELPPRPRASLAWERLRLIAKLIMLGTFATTLWQWSEYAQGRTAVPTELHGIWTVDTFVADGRDRPPLTTDAERWRKLLVSEHWVALRLMTDERRYLRGAEIDEKSRTIRVPIPDTVRYELWHYTFTDPNHLVVAGPYRNTQLHITFTREPPPLLDTRGFHWIQEQPFNR
jgi:uncharacterized membrane protein YphA (DoxX/SURF4 family)